MFFHFLWTLTTKKKHGNSFVGMHLPLKFISVAYFFKVKKSEYSRKSCLFSYEKKTKTTVTLLKRFLRLSRNWNSATNAQSKTICDGQIIFNMKFQAKDIYFYSKQHRYFHDIWQKYSVVCFYFVETCSSYNYKRNKNELFQNERHLLPRLNLKSCSPQCL